VAQAQSFKVDVGGRMVSLPAPSNYVQVSEADPEIFRLMDTTTPRGKRLIEVLVTRTDLARIRVGEVARDHMFNVYEELKWAGREPTPQEWRGQRDELRGMTRRVDASKTIGAMEDMLNESAERKLETPIRFDVGAIGQPVLYRIDESSARLFARMSVGANVGERNVSADMLVFAAYAPLNRRMMSFNGVCVCAQDDERARTLQAAFDDLIDQAISENKP
jgi:hypothetical protein